MKKRNLLVSGFFLLAGLTLGVGYAALTDGFVVFGDVGASADQNNLQVVFTDYETDGTRCSVVSDPTGTSSAELSFTGFDAAGETGSVSLTVTNLTPGAVGDELDVKLETPTILDGTYNKEYFSITATWRSDDVILEAERDGVSAGTNILDVTVTLKKTATETISNGRFEVVFSATTDKA